MITESQRRKLQKRIRELEKRNAELERKRKAPRNVSDAFDAIFKNPPDETS